MQTSSRRLKKLWRGGIETIPLEKSPPSVNIDNLANMPAKAALFNEVSML